MGDRKIESIFGGVKITFGEIAKTLVKYGEFSESGRFRRNARKGDETPTQYRSTRDQKLQHRQNRDMPPPEEASRLGTYPAFTRADW